MMQLAVGCLFNPSGRLANPARLYPSGSRPQKKLRCICAHMRTCANLKSVHVHARMLAVHSRHVCSSRAQLLLRTQSAACAHVRNYMYKTYFTLYNL